MTPWERSEELLSRDVAAGRKSPLTRKAYLTTCGLFRGFLAGRPPALALGAEFLEGRQGLAPATRAKHRAALSWLFQKVIGVSVGADDLPLYHPAPRLPRPPSLEGVEAMLGACETLLERALFLTIYAGGLRISEALGMHWPDVDFGQGVVIVIGKGNKERAVPLPPEALDVLAEYRGANAGKVSVFALDYWSARRLLQGVAKRTGVKGFRPHDLRHARASHLIGAGAGLYEVQNLLGHANPRTTEIYIHVQPKALPLLLRKTF